MSTERRNVRHENGRNAGAQFSLLSLFKLTLAVAVVLTIGIFCRGSAYFGALYSIWALVSLTIIACVGAVYRLRIVRPRALAWASVVIYTASMCMPALNVALRPAYGGSLLYLSYQWTGRVLWAAALSGGQPFTVSDSRAFTAAAGGTAANTSFIAACVLFLMSARWPMSTRFAVHLATTGVFLLWYWGLGVGVIRRVCPMVRRSPSRNLRTHDRLSEWHAFGSARA